jgi:hypothetical protein
MPDWLQGSFQQELHRLIKQQFKIVISFHAAYTPFTIFLHRH